MVNGALFTPWKVLDVSSLWGRVFGEGVGVYVGIVLVYLLTLSSWWRSFDYNSKGMTNL